MGCSDPLRRGGVGAAHQCLLGVGSKLYFISANVHTLQ